MEVQATTYGSKAFLYSFLLPFIVKNFLQWIKKVLTVERVFNYNEFDS